MAKNAGLKLYDYLEVVNLGKQHQEVELTDPTPETIYMFCYTSGTTGDPKGAKMCHEGFLACFDLLTYNRIDFTENDVSISYLPLAHIFEQFALFASLVYGFSHGYYSGDPLKLLEDI